MWQARKREGRAEKEDLSKPYAFGEVFFYIFIRSMIREIILLFIEELTNANCTEFYSVNNTIIFTDG